MSGVSFSHRVTFVNRQKMKKLFLSKLLLLSFKNYAQADVSFTNRFNCLIGNNGEGKTNLLDAIHYLSLTKSYFNPIDSQNILHDAPLFLIQGEFNVGDEKSEVICAQKRGEKKLIKLNKKEVPRFADHLGKFPVVMASPTDVGLILEGSEVRRKFVDGIISLYDNSYLENIIAYTKVLTQRNAQLKQFSIKKSFDMEALTIWDIQLIQLGDKIHSSRKEFSVEFEPIFQKYYKLIANESEQVGLVYHSQLLNGDFQAQLNEAIEKDKAMEYTSVGIHKDDWEFRLNNLPVKKFASQGQQKSYLLAVKLAQFEFIKKHKEIIPILMLDDVHDKLDESRVKRLIELVSSDDFGQVFITDTGKERIAKLFKNINSDFKLFIAKEGELISD